MINNHMLLNEFMNFKENESEMSDDGRYDSDHDSSVIKSSDLRKSRLTLKMLNDLRKAGDAREREQKEELALVRTMYATPTQETPQ